MEVKKGSIVRFHYTGSFDTGEEFGSTKGKKPIECKVGEGKILKGIEDALIGMDKSEKKGVVIYPDKAYGKRDENLVYKVRRDMLKDRNVEVGQIIKLKNKKGQIFDALVLAIESETIILDLNHPLAGKTLKLNIEVAEIK